MSWQRRLRELTLAGGTLLVAGCGMQSCCNANPDPCCAAPEGQQCKDEHACLAAGGDWADPDSCVLPDQGVAPPADGAAHD